MNSAKEDLREWSRRWREYREWAEANASPDPRPLEVIMRDLEYLYRSYSEEMRRADPDPEKLGIQNLRRVFGLVAAHERQRKLRTDTRGRG